MTRRDLIKVLLSTPIAATLDVEKLLWVPEKTIFLIPDRLTEWDMIHYDYYGKYARDCVSSSRIGGIYCCQLLRKRSPIYKGE